MRRFFLLILLILAGCNRDNNVLPTVAQPDEIGTAMVLTQFAPPVGYDSISLPHIDVRTEELSGWHSDMNFSFNGVYARTPRTTAASIHAEVYYDQVASARRVVATVDNDLEEASEPILFEGVQLGPDVFLVRDSRCIVASEQEATIIADLSAGELIGGVQTANVLPRISTINGEEVWQYSFAPSDVIIPNLVIPDDGRILSMAGELWFAPARNVVIRFYLTLQVENVLLLDQTLPVTGEVVLSYDLFEIGLVPNITQPNGC